jgi:putative sterol carrier protein
MASVPTFLQSVHTRQDDPVLRSFSGTIRFDLRTGDDVEPYTVSVADGRASVSRRRAKADCIASMDASLFDAVTSGKANAVTAFLRGEIRVEGDVAVLMAFERLFPGPTDARPTTTEPKASVR